MLPGSRHLSNSSLGSASSASGGSLSSTRSPDSAPIHPRLNGLTLDTKHVPPILPHSGSASSQSPSWPSSGKFSANWATQRAGDSTSSLGPTHPSSIHWNATLTSHMSHMSRDSLAPSDTQVVMPSLYDLILAINCDCGFDRFFTNLVSVLETKFGAERVSLCLPSDPTDLVNFPWGLKALWNKTTPLKKQAEASPSRRSRRTQRSPPSPSTLAVPLKNSTPGSPVSLHDDDDDNWHTEFEEDLDATSEQTKLSPTLEPAQLQSTLPIHPTRSGDFAAATKATSPTETNHVQQQPISPRIEITEAMQAAQLAQATFHPPEARSPNGAGFRRKLSQKLSLSWRAASGTMAPRQAVPTLQDSRISPAKTSHSTTSGQDNMSLGPTSIDSDDHFLVFDHTRTLDWEQDPLIDSQGILNLLDQDQFVLLQRRYTGLGCSRQQSASTDGGETGVDPLFLDSEQPMLSTWSHSPAPSPAVREYAESPFFNPDTEMESAFDQSSANSVLSDTPSAAPLDAIGFENTYSIGHLLLVVPSPDGPEGRSAPIAVLSFMSSLIPFPGPLRSLMLRFSPHIANSFLQASVQSNLESQLRMFMEEAAPSHSAGTPTMHHTRNSSVSSSRNSQHRSYRKSISRAWKRSRENSVSTRQPPRFDSSRQEGNLSMKPMSRPDLLDSSVEITPGSDGSNATLKADTPKERRTDTRDVDDPNWPSTLRGQRPKKRGEHLRKFFHSYGAMLLTEPELAGVPDGQQRPPERMRPSSRFLQTVIDAIPVHVFTAEPVSGEITWASNRTLAYRGQTFKQFSRSPLSTIHPDEQAAFKESWDEALRKGVPLVKVVKVQRFDGSFRDFFMRTVPLRDERGAITQWYYTMMDIHNQRQSELAEIQLARETAGDYKYKILAESSPIIVFSIHPSNGMHYANNKWFTFTGLSGEETYGFQFLNAIHPEDRPKCAVVFSSKSVGENTHKTGSLDATFSVELRLRNNDGNYLWHIVMFSSSDRENLEKSAWFGTCTNINDQKLIQEKLQEAKDAAQRTIESKSRFLSNMSHEIRTPLIGISGMISFLLDTQLSEEQLDYCHTISSSSEALLMVINDILDISKVESGKMTLTYSWFYVSRLVEEVNELLSSMAISKNLELNYVVSSEVPLWVKGDRVRIRQVMLNLIGNAIKFTDKGEVYTYCSIEPAGNEEGTVLLEVEVHDTGRGFTSEDAQRMFKPFSQVHGHPSSTALNVQSPVSTANGTSGTGLGLVISRQLIELHGGRLWCEGEKGKGSTFRFTCVVKLPTDDDHPAPNQTVKIAKRPSKSMSSSLSILVVCPWKFTCESIDHHIRATLQDPDKCVITAVDDLSEAMKVCSERSDPSDTTQWTHIIVNLNDIEMMIKCLFYLFKRTEELQQGSKEDSMCQKLGANTEIILLTSPIQRTTIQDRIKGHNCHNKLTFLPKPLKPSRYSVVFDPSRQQEESHDLKMQSAQKVIQTKKDIFLDLKTFADSGSYRILVAEDNLINQKVMTKFLSKAGLASDVAGDGVACTNKLFESKPGTYDLILCDLDMPRKDGFQTCRDIRAWEATLGEEHKKIPIVALSAYVMSDVAEKCNEVGFTLYISKPVEFGILKDCIVDILGKAKRSDK